MKVEGKPVGGSVKHPPVDPPGGRTPAGRSASWSQPASKTRSSLTRSSSAAAVACYGVGDSVGRL